MSLPIKPDSLIMQLLIRAKAFQDHAIGHANSHTAMDRMIAIHNLDNSIEYILKIVIKHLDIEEKTGKNLDTAELTQLAGDTNKFLKNNYSWELPYLADIKLIRQVRNLVQHAMVDPVADLPRHITIAQRFFERILSKVFGLDIREIRISTLIEDELLKSLLIKAEECIENKKYMEAIVASRDAFENYILFSTHPSLNKINLVPVLTGEKKRLFDLHQYLKHLNFEMELTKLGIEMRLYNKFEDYLRYIPEEYFVDRGLYREMAKKLDPSRDDALFCYSFVSDLIYKWESGKINSIYEEQMKVEDEKEEAGVTSQRFINDIEIKELKGFGAMYLLEKDTYIQYCVIENEQSVKRIKKEIKEGNKYKELFIFSKDGVEIDTRKREDEILVAFIDIQLVTNTPARWELIMKYTYLEDKKVTFGEINY